MIRTRKAHILIPREFPHVFIRRDNIDQPVIDLPAPLADVVIPVRRRPVARVVPTVPAVPGNRFIDDDAGQMAQGIPVIEQAVRPPAVPKMGWSEWVRANHVYDRGRKYGRTNTPAHQQYMQQKRDEYQQYLAA